MIDECVKLLERHIDNMQHELYKLKEDITFARRNYVNDLALPEQFIPCFDWRTRDEIPPKGLIWASDGFSIWTIHSQGTPIPESATSVLYWTNAYIPIPPLMRTNEAK